MSPTITITYGDGSTRSWFLKHNDDATRASIKLIKSFGPADAILPPPED